MSEAEKKKQMGTINGIFQMNVKSTAGKEGTWTIDFKKVSTWPALFWLDPHEFKKKEKEKKACIDYSISRNENGGRREKSIRVRPSQKRT